MNYWELFSLLIAAYFIGAIPFGLIISRARGINIRNFGSGNIGATNVFRVMGWKYGLPVFLLDAVKGYIPTMAALHLFPDRPAVHVLAGIVAIIGHSLTIFAGFKGGKGAATGLGVLLALSPDVFAVLFIIAVVLIATTRYVAPVTILCSLLTPLLLYIRDYPLDYIVLTALLAIFIIYRHKSNIARLLRGEENKI